MKKQINILELSSEIADMMINKFHSSIKIYESTSDWNTQYTEDAQELFDEYYDIIYDLVEKIGVEPTCGKSLKNINSIEVNRETFFLILSPDTYQTTEVYETHFIKHYSFDGQRGKIIYNHVSQAEQFYLEDINS